MTATMSPAQTCELHPDKDAKVQTPAGLRCYWCFVASLKAGSVQRVAQSSWQPLRRRKDYRRRLIRDLERLLEEEG